jgi:hypothetical protein
MINQRYQFLIYNCDQPANFNLARTTTDTFGRFPLSQQVKDRIKIIWQENSTSGALVYWTPTEGATDSFLRPNKIYRVESEQASQATLTSSVNSSNTLQITVTESPSFIPLEVGMYIWWTGPGTTSINDTDTVITSISGSSPNYTVTISKNITLNLITQPAPIPVYLNFYKPYTIPGLVPLLDYCNSDSGSDSDSGAETTPTPTPTRTPTPTPTPLTFDTTVTASNFTDLGLPCNSGITCPPGSELAPDCCGSTGVLEYFGSTAFSGSAQLGNVGITFQCITQGSLIKFNVNNAVDISTPLLSNIRITGNYIGVVAFKPKYNGSSFVVTHQGLNYRGIFAQGVINLVLN